MRTMMELGIPQAVLPPHDRPSIFFLRKLGYHGSDEEVLKSADPQLLALFSSSSSMWCANAATITPSRDSFDQKLHFTPANLASELHRCIEAEETYQILQKIFPFATVHPPLPSSFGDEGAANHIRLAQTQSDEGVHLLVYGRSLFDEKEGFFPARQTKEASEAIIRRHGISKYVLAKQKRIAIDAGVFHNDVISMGHENLFIYHEEAFEEDVAAMLQEKLPSLQVVKVTNEQLSLKEAVESYLFNSQIVRTPDDRLLLIAPSDCEKLDLSYLPFDDIHFVDLRQSMQNGGGPACLRLRVVLNEEEKAQTLPGVFLTPKLYEDLVKWVNKYYREALSTSDLADPLLLGENREALDTLTQILGLGSIYPFQH